ncbi:hypothetical protein KL86DES1_21956 [uncultured Desulfovibrio sp.]|uniref:Uncharacterized protein n=1 Tax=uncultured Desulfovibrio sp. TaxID=167968 RepID=A0A212LA73_9BACT|nr:hypothetical protein KL86DES1_21956 [uncultured Desulfovibrio sp.]VZH34850.1 conserved protein of unknown function [Desulfovibrio sp. 86]
MAVPDAGLPQGGWRGSRTAANAASPQGRTREGLTDKCAPGPTMARAPLELLPLEMLATAGKSLPVRVSWQGFSGKSLQSRQLISFVNCPNVKLPLINNYFI